MNNETRLNISRTSKTLRDSVIGSAQQTKRKQPELPKSFLEGYLTGSQGGDPSSLVVETGKRFCFEPVKKEVDLFVPVVYRDKTLYFCLYSVDDKGNLHYKL